MKSIITFQTHPDEEPFVRLRVVTETCGSMPMEFHKAADVYGPVQRVFYNELVPVVRIMTDSYPEGPSTLVFQRQEYQTEAVVPVTCSVTVTLCVGRHMPEEDLENLTQQLIIKPIIAKRLDPVFEQDAEDSHWATFMAMIRGDEMAPLSDLELNKLMAHGSPDTPTYEHALPIEVPIGNFAFMEGIDPEDFAPRYVA